AGLMEDNNKPWLKFYGDVPPTIDYPKTTMYGALMRTVENYPDSIAYDFLGFTATYREFAAEIDEFADILADLGLKAGNRITISMPTSPQGVICFYAVNKLGAAASMIHPLSTTSEIEFYVNVSKSRFALTIDAFYGKFREVMDKTDLELLILTKISDYLTPLKKVGFYLTKGRKIPGVPPDPRVRWWRSLMKAGAPRAPEAPSDTNDPAVILYSGGTTGTPKGILLSNRNFISEGMQCAHWGGMGETDSILAILPIFHGFGLGVCVNAVFMGGGKSILVPTFTPEEVAKLIRKKRPTLLVGVPTLYEALNRNPVFQNTDLSCLKAAFSGADTLPRVVKERFEEIVKRQGGSVKLLEGFGLTEAVTAIMAMPVN
ncbi:MAG: AMP-binding protein, partial [Desulfobacterales bacterium]|nr:AMP-binding protein [Desulfobacterales bacterium]